MAISKVVIVLVLTTLFVNVFAASLLRKERTHLEDTAHKENVTENKIVVCENLAPCGWGVYKPFHRNMLYFMKNECECPQGKKCVRVEDDVSISAYVYRCRVEE